MTVAVAWLHDRAGKRIAETACMSYKREGFVDIRIARIFNTFGPRMHPDDGRVVSNFIKQVLTLLQSFAAAYFNRI